MKRSASPPPLQLFSGDGSESVAGGRQTDGGVQLAGWFSNDIVHGPDFLTSEDGVNLNGRLLARMNNLCNHLIDNNLVNGDITYNEGVRSPRRAHRWSTAYNIRQGAISTQTLRNLPDGKDQDGNKWYDPAWRNGEDRWWPMPDLTERDLIVRNAERIWSGARANEGYPAGDARRHPNISSVPVSTHVGGQAIDASIPWKVGAWSNEANELVDRFGLKRPETDEHWHFESK